MNLICLNGSKWRWGSWTPSSAAAAVLIYNVANCYKFRERAHIRLIISGNELVDKELFWHESRVYSAGLASGLGKAKS